MIKKKRRKPSEAELRSKSNLERLIKVLTGNSTENSFYFFMFHLPENCDHWIDRSLADFQFRWLSRMESDPVRWSGNPDAINGHNNDDSEDDSSDDDGGYSDYSYRHSTSCDDENEYPYFEHFNLGWRTANMRRYLEKFRRGRLSVYSNGFPPNRRRSPIKTVVLQQQHFWKLVKALKVENRENQLGLNHPWSFWGEVCKHKP
jgi:hypothetical protein